MISPYPFQPRGRLLDVMRQVGDPELINLAAGLPSVHCVPKADLREAFAATLEENADEALGYHVPDGDLRLRELLVERFRRRGIDTSVDKMVITTGCSQALHGMIRLVAKPGDVVACEAPAYYSTLEIMGDLGVKVLPIPVRDSDGIDFELTQTLFRRFKPKLFVLCSTLSNPSGATVPNETRKALVELCRETGTRILEDEIYGELSEITDLKPIRAYDDGSTVSYVTSFSKTVAPGLRVGVCLPGVDANPFALQKCQQDMHSATLCEVAFRRYFETGRFDSHLEFLRKLNRERRELGLRTIAECFPASAKIWRPAGGFLLWVDLTSLAQCEAKIPELFEEVMTDLKKSGALDQIKSAFIKIRFSDFTRTTVERAGLPLTIENFQALLRQGLSRKSLNVRLLGLGVRFQEPDSEGATQLELQI